MTSEFFAQVYAGAAKVAAEHGFGVVLYPSPEGIGPARDPFDSARTALDSVIASSMAADALASIRGERDLPLVMLDSDPAEPGPAAHVNLDIADGVRRLTTHLLDLGHRRFTHIAADVDSWTFLVRARALAQALVGVPTPSCAPSGPPQRRRRTPGRAPGPELPGPHPTALVCDDDFLAAGACKAAHRLGLRIPDDISVAGFAASPSPPPWNRN